MRRKLIHAKLFQQVDPFPAAPDVYSDVPPDVFPHGVNIENAEDRPYAMATCEKALCDKLYKEHPIAGKRAMGTFLFENLRIEVGDFRNLDFDFIEKVAPLYRKKNLQILSKMR